MAPAAKARAYGKMGLARITAAAPITPARQTFPAKRHGDC